MAGLAVGAACSSGDDGDGSASTGAGPTTTEAETTSTAAGSAPCSEDRHVVVVDLGVLTFGTSELARWVNEEGYDMTVRPGAVELLQAYRQRGYEVAYLSGLPSDTVVGPAAAPVAGALEAWQSSHGFPTGQGTTVLLWDRQAFESVNTFKTEAVVRLAVDGAVLDYGYTDDENDVRAFRNGGIAAEHIFTIEGEGGTPGTSGVPETDWTSHRTRFVDPLPPVCRV